MTTSATAAFVAAIAEPTRLRILNCVAAAPLFVSDLVAILGLPQPTVSRHLRVLRAALTHGPFRTERDAARARTRESVRVRVAGVGADVG